VFLWYLFDVGVWVVFGVDDLLLFGSRLVDQYCTVCEVYDLDDAALVELVRASICGSWVLFDVRVVLLADVDVWFVEVFFVAVLV